MIERGVQVFEDYFNRAQAFTTTPGMNGWTIADTSAAGTPTYLCATDDGGKAVLTLANTNEAENVCLYQNDVLAWDVDRILIAEFTVLVSGVDANTVVTWGLASARNDDEDAIANSVFFKIEGGASTSNVVAETTTSPPARRWPARPRSSCSTSPTARTTSATTSTASGWRPGPRSP
jgi:hypothetical protein